MKTASSPEFPERILRDYRENSLHPDDRRVELKNPFLQGITIAYCVTGGVGAVESVRVIRELRRYGASVRVYATPHALAFTTPLSLEWASGKPVITTLTAVGEQVMSEDILLICPATANIIAKAAVGIADETVSTLIAGALGKRGYCLEKEIIPPSLIMVPTMHVFLAAHPSLKDHYRKLEENGFLFLDPRRDEDKLKMPTPETIAQEVSHAFYQNHYRYRNGKGPGKGFDPLTQKVLITAGATAEPIDGVRLLTNRSTGTTGLVLASYLYALGIKIHLLFPEGRDLPPYLSPHAVLFSDYASYQEKVLQTLNEDRERSFTWGIFIAAVSDFKPESFREEKMRSDRSVEVRLLPQPKVIAQVREAHPDLTMMVFKYTVGREVEEIAPMVKEMGSRYDFVIVNRKEDLGEKKVRFLFSSREPGEPYISSGDRELSSQIADTILNGGEVPPH